VTWGFTGALGGNPNLLIRSKIPGVQISPELSDRPARKCLGGCLTQVYPWLSRSAVSKRSKISLSSSRGPRLLLGRWMLLAGGPLADHAIITAWAALSRS